MRPIRVQFARTIEGSAVTAAGWPAVVSLGEVLVDFVALDGALPLTQATTFRRAAGGAPANVAVALARLGTPSTFLGKVGGDAFGRFLQQTLADEGVDIRGLVEDVVARTPLAFVGSDGKGGRSFVFYHAGMAHTLLRPEEVNREMIVHAAVFHFGSVTLAAEPSREATLTAARCARQHNCLVSFDPNVRLELWDSPRRARDSIVDSLEMVDVVKVSGDELEFLTGTPDPAEACHRLREYGPSLAVVTLGADGCQYESVVSSGHVPSVHVESVDTLGAGDAFVAGLLAGLSAQPAAVMLRDEQALGAALRFANAVGAFTTTQYGAIPALPTRAQVEHLLDPSHASTPLRGSR
ncbi:MAG: PfkB family carbohydrate kinase [Chloroflexi bacterium]|nr:PfkB family carbohydrate kinase [Chloroflexota bacterium]